MRIVKGIDRLGRECDVYLNVEVSEALAVFKGIKTIEEMKKALELMKDHLEDQELQLENSECSKLFRYDEDYGFYLKSDEEDIFGI